MDIQNARYDECLCFNYRGIPVETDPEWGTALDNNIVYLRCYDGRMDKLLPGQDFTFIVDGKERTYNWGSTIQDKEIANAVRESLIVRSLIDYRIFDTDTKEISISGKKVVLMNLGSFLSEVASLDTFEGKIEDVLNKESKGWTRYPALLYLDFSDPVEVKREIDDVRGKLTVFESIMTLSDIEKA